jgi:ceramide glucosyltransferase
MQAPDVGLVTSVFHGVGERTLGALLENLHLNSWIAGGMCGAQILTGQAAVNGKSMLFRRSDLERIGGWPVVQDILAEDYVIGRLIAGLGLRIVTSRSVVATVNDRWSVGRFFNRHLRWATLRRHLVTPLYFLEFLVHPVLWWGIVAQLGHPLLAAGGIALKVSSDALLARRLRGRFYPPWYLLLIPLKDIAFAAIWIVGMFRHGVSWRGHPLRVGPGTVLRSERPFPKEERIPSPAPARVSL